MEINPMEIHRDTVKTAQQNCSSSKFLQISPNKAAFASLKNSKPDLLMRNVASFVNLHTSDSVHYFCE